MEGRRRGGGSKAKNIVEPKGVGVKFLLLL